MGGGGFAADPDFVDIGYGPSVACTVGCTWLMYSLCMAHIWPMYDLHMAQITRVPWQKKSVICCRIALYTSRIQAKCKRRLIRILLLTTTSKKKHIEQACTLKTSKLKSVSKWEVKIQFWTNEVLGGPITFDIREISRRIRFCSHNCI